ncbi:40S ribosomal protein S30 [Colletotrichum acutatum]
MGKVHGSLARAGKVKSQTPKVEPQEKKKTPKGRAKKRLTYTRRFVNVTLTGGKRKDCRDEIFHKISPERPPPPPPSEMYWSCAEGQQSTGPRILAWLISILLSTRTGYLYRNAIRGRAKDLHGLHSLPLARLQQANELGTTQRGDLRQLYNMSGCHEVIVMRTYLARESSGFQPDAWSLQTVRITAAQRQALLKPQVIPDGAVDGGEV